MTRFEKFNEMLFESYCKKSVTNAIKKERQRKAAKGKVELSLSALTDAVLYALSTESDGTSQPEKPYRIFKVQGMDIPIYHERLSQALSYLIPQALQEGKLVIAIMAKGHFTSGGHFIVLRGVTEEGNILVADPASVKRSNQEWALGIITNEASRKAGSGGPFWVFSA